ncbi:hypothetical protein B4U79_02640 [Dinothrombium tinctorium]|uniref:Uncharacterized protein n=1 Tax=Dinothrombium tinctorium TaxID=1965070 RepID=A0A3S3P3Y9_9ACAR|nr:hypothetical protein B4U79_05823 [Dinothrombium tinctorium]RWS07794.1 hypothetical protein B4U79_02640 [Dinothrombium tinctorium]
MTRSSSFSSKLKASIRRTSANIMQKIISADYSDIICREGLETLASRMKRTRSMSVINQEPESADDIRDSGIKMSASTNLLSMRTQCTSSEQLRVSS